MDEGGGSEQGVHQDHRAAVFAFVSAIRAGMEGTGPWPTMDEVKRAIVGSHLLATDLDDATIAGIVRRGLSAGVLLVEGASFDEAIARVSDSEDPDEEEPAGPASARLPHPYSVTPAELHAFALGTCAAGEACTDPDCGFEIKASGSHAAHGLRVACFPKDAALQIVCGGCGDGVARIEFSAVLGAPRFDA